MGRGHGWRRGVRLVPDAAARGAFLEALRGRATVTAAAKAAGVSLCALYAARRRDAAFAGAWDEAVALTSAPVWRPRPGGASGRAARRRSLGLARPRRTRFCAARKAAFLKRLARTCNLEAAAGRAGVARRTVYRHLARDPGFAAAAKAALERGYAWLERLAERQRREAGRRMRSREIVPTGRPTGDFDLAMKLLARWWRPAEPAPGHKKRPPAPTREDVLELLDTKLARLDIRIVARAAGAQAPLGTGASTPAGQAWTRRARPFIPS